MSRMLCNPIVSRRISTSSFSICNCASKQRRTFSSQPSSKQQLPPLKPGAVAYIYGASLALLGNLSICYVMNEDPTFQETAGKFLPEDIQDVMMSVGSKMKPIADPITQALGIQLGETVNKTDTLSPALADKSFSTKIVTPPVQQTPSETAVSAPKVDHTTAAEVASTTTAATATTATATTSTNSQEETHNNTTSSPPGPPAVTPDASAAVNDAASSSSPPSPSSSSSPSPSVVVSSSLSSFEEDGLVKRLNSEEEEAEPTTKLSVRDVTGDIMKQSIALRKELEATVLKDIGSLDESTLRKRIAQLAGEIFERITWEGIQANHAIQQVESRLEMTYATLMAQQRVEADIELQRRMLEKEKESFGQATREAQEMLAKYEEQFNSAVKAQAEGFRTTLQKNLDDQTIRIRNEMQDELMHQVATIRKSQVDELMELQPTVDEVCSDLQSLSGVASSVKDLSDTINTTRAASTALLSLESALATLSKTVPTTLPTKRTTVVQANAVKTLSSLAKLCKNDEMSLAVLQSLPPRVMEEGVCSVPELQQRFSVLREEVRKASLAPESAPNKLLGQLVGSTLAALTFAPSGYVRGEGLEESLSRAEYFVDRARFKEALLELESGVKGAYAVTLMQDWKERAQERLAVDQSLTVIKAAIVLRHKSS